MAKANGTLAIGGVPSPLDIPIAIGFVVAESLMLRTNPDSYRDADKPSPNAKPEIVMPHTKAVLLNSRIKPAARKETIYNLVSFENGN